MQFIDVHPQLVGVESRQAGLKPRAGSHSKRQVPAEPWRRTQGTKGLPNVRSWMRGCVRVGAGAWKLVS